MKGIQFSVGRLLIVVTAVALAAGLLRSALGPDFVIVQILLTLLVGLIAAIATKKDFTSKPLPSPKWAILADSPPDSAWGCSS